MPRKQSDLRKEIMIILSDHEVFIPYVGLTITDAGKKLLLEVLKAYNIK